MTWDVICHILQPFGIAQAARSSFEQADTLLLLGKGHETYQEIGGVQLHLDEREEVARILKEQKK